MTNTLRRSTCRPPRDLPPDHFYRNAQAKSRGGRAYSCKDCVRERNRIALERLRANKARMMAAAQKDPFIEGLEE